MKKTYFLFSFLAHALLLLSVIIVVQFYPKINSTPQYQKLNIKNITTNIGKKKQEIAPVKKKQEVAPEQQKDMPIERPVLQEIAKKEVSNKEVKKVDVQTTKTLQKKSSLAKEDKKAVEHSKKETEEQFVDSVLASLAKEESDSLAIENVLSQLEAEDVIRADGMDYGTYVDIVGNILRNQWFYPNLGRRENFKVVVRIFVDSSGLITEYKIEQSSGREDFDASAIRAIEQYTHFPVPPEKRAVDFIVNFNLLEE